MLTDAQKKRWTWISIGVAAILGLSLVWVSCNDNRGIPNGNTAVPTTETPGTTEKVYELDIPAIEQKNAELSAEAEEGRLYGNLEVSDEREGYSGDGYVTGFDGDADNKVVVEIEVPATQHYDITLCAAADEEVRNTLLVNGEDIGEFTIAGKGEFLHVTFHGVFIEAGKARLSIEEIDGGLDLDSFTLTNNTDLYEISYEDAASQPVNEDASPEAKALLRNLASCYGKTMLTGQYASSAQNQELELIHNITGQYPVIRFGDLGSYTDKDTENAEEIEAAIAWSRAGGVVGFMWYWTAPMEQGSVYADKTDFRLSKAVTGEDIAQLDSEELQELLDQRKISAECYALVESIDQVAGQLARLKDADVPVLWRPLHEAGGGWYWWGSDGADAYQWLWRLLYDRLTAYHGLNNLLWVWNGQSRDYYVGQAYYDIASIDVYLRADAEYGSRYGQFQWLYALTKGEKLLALSECSRIPDVDAIFRDNAVWSFFGLWYGDYLVGQDGTLNGKYLSTDDLIKYYNSYGTLSLSEYIKMSQKSLAN